jgi:(1->4)-alpha-D-glucan 1-alpha-D-glucosylmutase
MTSSEAQDVARPVRATYRLQLRPGFGFDEATAILGYLARLGVSHVYCSPYLASVPGSPHGYDVVDHRRIRDDLGGEPAFDRFVSGLADAGLGQVIDIVPHHMSITGTENRWWWDVLTFGRGSSHADWFDIDWDPPQDKLRSLILLPVLGDHYGRVLESGDLSVDQRTDGSFVVRYYDLAVPLAPHSVAQLLATVAERNDHARLRFLAHALAAADDPDASPTWRVADVGEALAAIVELQLADQQVDRAVRIGVALVNADADELDGLLEHQHYRLARWTVGAYELDYRRFFDVDSLIALRTERDDVFEATHGLVLGWVRAGVVDGVRVDHVDGLRDPAGYLDRLRAGIGDTTYLVVEKILSEGEALRAWPVEGTTGYEFADLATGVLVEPEGADGLRAAYAGFTGDARTYREVSFAKRHLVLTSVLASDLERLTNLLTRICEGRRRYRDFTRVELRAALLEVLVHVPAYRSYVRLVDGEPVVSEADLDFVDLAVGRAREHRPDLDPELFDVIRAVLTLEFDGSAERELALRFQQLSGPVVAKGDEDSAHYTWVPLAARNDVGVDPDRLSVGPAELHAANARRQQDWPRSMLTTSTHDTKRSEDVRARLAVLAEVADEWVAAVVGWWDRSAGLRSPAGPDTRTAWLVFETLVGAHPLTAERAVAYVQKALREAKERTSWLQPDAAFEEAVEAYTAGLLADPVLSKELAAFAERITTAGRVNALSQVALRLLSPGVPDTYQGTELWDLSLVDPDNRRPVDYARRVELLDELGALPAARVWRERADDGLPKLLVVQRLLALRAERPIAFGERARYEPLAVGGPGARHAFGFVRAGEVAVVVPRFPLTLVGWADEVAVHLPAGRWADWLTAATVESDGSVSLAELTSEFPIAVLVRP